MTKDPAPPAEPPPVISTPPHLAGEDEAGAGGSEADWWRIDNGPYGFSDSVPGFVGGVEIPEILRPPKDESEAEESEEDAEPDDEEGAEEEAEGGRRRFLGRRPRAVRGAPGLSNPLLLLAAAALVIGAVSGNWIALGVGWAVAYSSRRLTQTEAKLAVLGLPGVVAGAGVVWLWGRFDHRWGEAVPKDGTVDALSQTWPWVVRVAAVASALFLVWRSQRRRPE
ncbi:hypothetical protein GUY60_37295 [Streptomyces sp. YC537]|uniref:Uncharacterized protein n=1 Tax=Streptomyces boluensis TaxID=1775135 RepID=A0A964XR41_9ACTN|nr:hypothetical protein [Streptomyces boluensis]